MYFHLKNLEHNANAIAYGFYEHFTVHFVGIRDTF